MFLVHGDEIIDYSLDFLTEILSVVDRHIKSIARECPDEAEADEFGYFDRMEYATGLGFVACQAYMSATYGYAGFDKAKALSLGPRHHRGPTVAHVLNAGANYWKHHDEWPAGESRKGRQYVEEVFTRLGVAVDADYPLSTVLARLTEPSDASFALMPSLLADWRDTLRKEHDGGR